MSKPRRPRNLDEYSSAEDAARGLEALAADLRASADIHPLVRWYINVSYWNPAWEETKGAQS